MAAQPLPWTYNDNKIYGTVTVDGINVPAVGAVLYSVQEDGTVISQVDYDTTNETGNWQFGITESGWYTIKFYGGGTIPEQYILRVYLEYSPTGTDFDPLEYAVNPEINVTELSSKVNVNKNEIARIQIVLSNLTPTDGNLRSVEIYYRRTEESGDYQPFKTVPVVDDSISVLTIRAEIELQAKPDYYDFYAVFIDGIGIPYKISGVVYVSYDTNVQLDGVPDAYEYVEGLDLEAINTVDPEEGVLQGNMIKLKWTDLRTLEESSFPFESRDAFGRIITITYEMAQRLENYVVYMFISNTNNQPSQMYPGLTALYGAVKFGETEYGFKDVNAPTQDRYWVFMGEAATADCELNVPYGKYVAFWMGFKTLKTQTQILTQKYIY